MGIKNRHHFPRADDLMWWQRQTRAPAAGTKRSSVREIQKADQVALWFLARVLLLVANYLHVKFQVTALYSFPVIEQVKL